MTTRIDLIREKVKLEIAVKSCNCWFGGIDKQGNLGKNVCLRKPSCEEQNDRIAEIESELLQMILVGKK